MSKAAWKPWREVVQVREDLKSGELPMHMFAADLYEVAMQRGLRPLYEKPDQFFSLTYPTYNLRQLAKDVVMRLAGQNDKAVRQLELTYGGGKTHTLITLFHLVNDPASLPDIAVVREFKEEAGIKLPQARVACMCFDKMDAEKGIEVRSPTGEVRWLKYPWSWLAYQIAGDEGLAVLSASGSAEERVSPPAEPLLVTLLSQPIAQGMGVLILLDEVLMFARRMADLDRNWTSRLVDFFQYLTQAATKVDRCCIVASLLATDPAKADQLGKEIQGDLYGIFQRQREESVQPVEKTDVAEILRRRFFQPKSIQDKDAFKPHVVAALKGVTALDEQTANSGVTTEQAFLASYPFHPELTEVFYTKWTALDRFQRTRGILRTFALALREAAQWDHSPLIGANVFLSAPGQSGLSEAARELVTVAEIEESEGQRANWAPIIEAELQRARQIQEDAVGLKYREIEQAVFATFLHSQPIGQSAQTRDLLLLVGPTRPDKIELEKGLIGWARTSYWLDDRYTNAENAQVPKTWRLGNRPNLNQMHAEAARNIQDELVEARLLDEISKVKKLTADASAFGVRVHTQPTLPSDIEDDGEFHYAVLGPSAASDSGKPSPVALRFLDETTGANKPRVYRNAVVLACPSRDGVEVARRRIREYLAWLDVQAKFGKTEDGKEVRIDPVRATTLMMKVDEARKRVPEAIRTAYCIVVTVGEDNNAKAFKLQLKDESLFLNIKEDERANIKDTAINAEALVPGGPYNLWREGEDSRRIKDLVGAFAQLPKLPKMLNTKAILETLVRGCEEGSFVLRLPRPNRTFRTWWRTRPDDQSLKDPAMEVVLAEKAELSEIETTQLARDILPGLWSGETLKVSDVEQYFRGGHSVEVQRGSYTESLLVPRAAPAAIAVSVATAVEGGVLWLLAGPSSLYRESVPPGIITAQAELRPPPAAVPATDLLPAILPTAWHQNASTALSLATSLSQQKGAILPWLTVRTAIDDALRARFIELSQEAVTLWPCDISGAKSIALKFREASSPPPAVREAPGVFVAESELSPAELQDLCDQLSDLLSVVANADTAMRLMVKITVGTQQKQASETAIAKANALLQKVAAQLELRGSGN